MAGFTLIEILIALTLLGAVLVGLQQGTRLGLVAWDRQTATIHATAELDAVDRTLRALVAQAGSARGASAALPPGVPGASSGASPRAATAPRGGGARPAATTGADGGLPDDPGGFIGAPDLMAFEAVLPGAVAVAGRRAHVELMVVPGQRLVMRWVSVLLGAETGRPLTGEATLLTGVRAIALRYFGSPGPGKAAAWYDRWSGAAPPALVRIHFALADGREWPDIIAASLIESGAT
jgi:general secretion pathway protein J